MGLTKVDNIKWGRGVCFGVIIYGFVEHVEL